MAYRVEVTARAEKDLETIFKSVDAENSDQAFAWFRGLAVLIATLKENPHRGVTTRENGERRQLLYGHKPHVYRIIYRVRERAQRVEVLHIRHGARDVFM